MPTLLSSPDILWKSYVRLWSGRRELLPLAGGLFAAFLAAALARAVFPGVYTFHPKSLMWLLIPEAAVIGPLLALLAYRLTDTGRPFGWSLENRVVKLLHAVGYYYGLFLLLLLGKFATTQVVPALVGFVFGAAAIGLYPVIVAVGFVAFLLFYARLVLVYPVLTGDVREPLIRAVHLSRGKTRQIVSCLLLLAAPVLIPWIVADTYGGDWLNPSHGPGIRIVPILTRSLLQTAGALLLSSGLCVMHDALVADEEAKSGDTDKDA